MTSPREIVRVEIVSLSDHNIRSDPGEVADLLRLGESLKKKQDDPILITKNGRIIKGHRRVAAARLVGLTHLDALVVDDCTSVEITEEQVREVIHSQGIPDVDKALALKLIKDARGWGNKQIAEHVNIDPGTASRYFSLFDCIPEAIEAAKAGKIGVTKWCAISRSQNQYESLAVALNGASRDELERRVRQEQNGAPTAKAQSVTKPKPQARIRMPIAAETVSGTVTLAGVDDLEEGENLLKEALRAIKKARDTGLDLKTAQAVWRDIAAAS